MRQPVFASPSDPDGRRARSLDLYGVTASYRRDDGLARDFAEIVQVAAGASGAVAAALDLWTASDLIRLAGTAEDTELGARVRAALVNRLPATVVVVDDAGSPPATAAPPTTAEPATTTTAAGPAVAAPLVGREGATLGLLVIGFAAPLEVPEQTTLLLKHLAGAAVGVLDRQRRAWERRGRPGASPLRAVDGRDRRTTPPDTATDAGTDAGADS